jgi:hypothetical protein
MVLHKKIPCTQKMESGFFCKENENPFGTIVFDPNTHACAQYGHLWTNYAIVTTMT